MADNYISKCALGIDGEYECMIPADVELLQNQLSKKEIKQIAVDLGSAESSIAQDAWNTLAELVGENIANNIKNRYLPNRARNGPLLWDIEILQIMKGYENMYPDFYYISTPPSDCHQYRFCALWNFRFEDYFTQGKRKFGIIYNTDPASKSGEHWIPIWMDVDENIVEMNDSLGHSNWKDLLWIVKEFQKFTKKYHGKKATFYRNKKIYQTDYTSCGIYSCHYLISRLGGVSQQEYNANPLSSSEIKSCNHLYFRGGDKREACSKCQMTNHSAKRG